MAQNNGGGWTTTIDSIQQQQSRSRSLHGVNGVHDQIDTCFPQSRVLRGTTNIISASPASKRLCLDPARKKGIEASRICNVDNDRHTEDVKDPSKQKVACVPGPSQNLLLSLSHSRYGLPDTLVRNFASLGINSIYPWQSSCLLGHGLLTGEKNLVYTAPTGGGKSLVADVLMLKKVIKEPSKKAILVLPYVALVQEKLKWLRKAVEGVEKSVDSVSGSSSQLPKWRQKKHNSSIRVVGFFGGSKARVSWSDVDICVCTIEKANSLVNTAIEDCTIKDLGIVVLDELHMIDDDHRGYIMELMASKLLSLEYTVQIVGMSATLTNTQVLARWLDAGLSDAFSSGITSQGLQNNLKEEMLILKSQFSKYYNTKYAPVPIEEFLVYDHSIFPVSTSSAFFKTASQISATQPLSGGSASRAIRPSDYAELKNPVTNAVVSLAVETAKAGYGALVFCSGRQGCQSTASLVAETMQSTNIVDPEVLDRRKDVVSELRSLAVGLDETLGKTVLRGVAFHHAGLTVEERDIVAEAYDQGVLSVIVATCSLAAGINLPARRVILQGARMGRDLIGPAMLRQMRGRAGRKGKDEIGESYLCCRKVDLEEVAQLLEADLPMVGSSLTPEKRGIKRALLEVITVRLATHITAIREYVQRTLLYHTMDRALLSTMVVKALEELIDSGLITVDSLGLYNATLLSQATVASYLSPEDGIFLHGELRRALQAFVMDGDMHIFYTFTPVYTSVADIHWPIFRNEIDSLDESGLRVLEFVGVNPALVNRMANSARLLPENTAEEVRIARIYRRFYVALQLRDLCNEMPIHVVARKFEVSRGSVQTLAQVCESFAAGMIKFCERMGWGMLKVALEHMFDRLKAGARADLLELAKIPFVKSRTARVFWENGYKGLRTVAESDAKDLLPILLLAQPKMKKSGLDGEEERKYHQKLLLKAEIIVGAANRLWEGEQHLDIED